MRLYVLHEGGVFSLDVTNNDQFSLPAVYNQLEQPSAMAINQTRTRLYVADRNGHIHVLDVTDPRSPSLIFRLSFQANIVDMLIHAGQLFAIDGANRLLHRFDISQANTVAWKDSLALPEKPLRIRSLLNELLIPVNKKGIVRVQMSNGA
jgi:hypothetical protein